MASVDISKQIRKPTKAAAIGVLEPAPSTKTRNLVEFIELKEGCQPIISVPSEQTFWYFCCPIFLFFGHNPQEEFKSFEYIHVSSRTDLLLSRAHKIQKWEFGFP